SSSTGLAPVDAADTVFPPATSAAVHSASNSPREQPDDHPTLTEYPCSSPRLQKSSGSSPCNPDCCTRLRNSPAETDSALALIKETAARSEDSLRLGMPLSRSLAGCGARRRSATCAGVSCSLIQASRSVSSEAAACPTCSTTS